MTSPYQAPSADLEGDSMVACIGCGAKLHITAGMCPHCGASQRSKRYKNKITAALCAFFLGGLGVHRFYLGQWWGIFYILFSLFWISGLIAFVECIVFLVADQKQWDEKYNEGKAAGPNETGNTGLIIIGAVVGLFVFVAVIGILAAVAIPAYQDYVTRAQAL